MDPKLDRPPGRGNPILAHYSEASECNIPPDVLHWHGASPDRLFAHLALSEAGEQGQGTAWGKHVSDTEYNEPVTGV